MRTSATDAAFAVTALLLWAGAAYKLVRARRGLGRRASYLLVCCLVCLAAAVTLQIRPVFTASNQLLGEGRWLFISEALAIAAVSAYQILMVVLNDPYLPLRRALRPRLPVALVVLAGVGVLFFLSSSPYPGLRPAPADPAGAAQLALFVGYFGAGAVDVARSAFRFSRLGGDRYMLRLALYMISAHACCSALYAAVRLVGLVLLAFLGPGVLKVQYAITNPLIVLSSALVVIGSTLPSWGPRVGLGGVAAWFGRYMSYLTLYPLWREMVRLTPGSVLESRPPWVDRLIPTDLDFRITRRVIEIRDGLLLLEPHRDEATRTAAHQLAVAAQLRGTERDAAIEAAVIAGALATATSGARGQAADTDIRIGAAAAGPAATRNAPSLSDEVSWLAQVSHALQNAPLVRAVGSTVAHHPAHATHRKG